MRLFLAIVVLATWWAWQGSEGVDDVADGAEASSDPVVSEAPGGLLPEALEPLWARQMAGPEPAPDPVVYCRRPGGDTFLRQSACELAGGLVDEPHWARLD